jgi:hypothetical protein
MLGDGYNRMFNYQRDALVKITVWTTEDDRRRALSYADRNLDVQTAIDAMQAGNPVPDNFGVILAAARYEDAGWMPDGCFDRWRRWATVGSTGVFNGVERKSVDELVRWLGEVERGLKQHGQVP